jgi:hypothetical protein
MVNSVQGPGSSVGRPCEASVRTPRLPHTTHALASKHKQREQRLNSSLAALGAEHSTLAPGWGLELGRHVSAVQL